MRKVIYYYSSRYPEYPIEEVPVKDLGYHTTRGGTKWLTTIYTEYNINTGMLDKDCEYWHSIIIYPTDDPKIFYHETEFPTRYIFSPDKRILEARRQEDIKYQLKQLKGRLEKLEDARRK